MYALVEAARSLGFSAKGVKGPITALPGVPLPAIAHVLIDQRLYHYLVLVAWSRRDARVMDPASGRIEKWTHEQFTAVWTGVLILLAPGETFRPGDRTTSPWQRLWSLVGPHKAALIQAFAGAMASTVLALSMSIYVQKIIDSVIPDGNPRLLDLLTAAMLAILAVRLVLGVFQSLLSLRTAQCIDATLILASRGLRSFSYGLLAVLLGVALSTAAIAPCASARSLRAWPMRSRSGTSLTIPS